MKPPVFVTRRLPAAALEELRQACEVDLWDKTVPPPYETLAARVRGKAGVLCLLTDRIDAPLLDGAPDLRVISQVAVGVDNIDLDAATARGIRVGHTPGVLTEATADFTFTLLLAAARRLGEAIDTVRSGEWRTWGLTELLGQQVWGTTLGIIGLGRIGAAVARRAAGFQMEVLYYGRRRQPDLEAALGVAYRPLDDLLRASDFVTLHVDLNDSTRGLIDRRALGLMKPTAVLVNTARGPVVDRAALHEALEAGGIAAAALDVTDPEPLPAGDPLLELPNLIVAPHIASATVAARTRMATMAVRNLIAGLRGEPLPHPAN